MKKHSLIVFFFFSITSFFYANAVSAYVSEASLDDGILTFDPTFETEKSEWTITQIQSEENDDPNVINFLVKFSDKTKKPIGFFRKKDEKNQDFFIRENIAIFKEADGEYIFSVKIEESEKSPARIYLGYNNIQDEYCYVEEIILFFSHKTWIPVFIRDDPYTYRYKKDD